MDRFKRFNRFETSTNLTPRGPIVEYRNLHLIGGSDFVTNLATFDRCAARSRAS